MRGTELYTDMLYKEIGRSVCEVVTPSMFNCAEVMERESIRALDKIRAILKNDSLDDFECIERIVAVLEDIGSDAGNRHDFG